MSTVKLPELSSLPPDTPNQGTESTMAADTPVAQNLPDVVMSDAPLESAPSPALATLPATNAPSPIPPQRTGTPSKHLNGVGGGPEQGSRAASAHPDPGFTMPSEAPPHGHTVRKYLNTKVTGVLLEGMKQIAKDQPRDPLRVLGEFLIQRSKELEGSA